MESLLRDVRFGLKLLLRDKLYGLTVLLTLAVCIGANVAIFSVVHTVVLEPLPYPNADRLAVVFNSYPGAGVERASNGTVDYYMRRERVDAFQEVALWQGSGNAVGEPGSTEWVRSVRVTPSFFHVLGVEAARGRTFTEDETDPGNELEVVLTHGYWQEQFGGDPAVIGKDLRVDGRPYAVVGVLPEDFEMVEREGARFFMPIPLPPEARDLDNWHSNSFQMLARLAPGATVEQAQAQNEALNQALIDQWPAPNGRQLLKDAGYSTKVVMAQDDLIRDVRPTLFLLWAGVAFVLLIGCVNIANLILARAYRRAGELATRIALGAERFRLARQVLTEAAVMALLGGLLGVGMAELGLGLISSLGVDSLPRGSDVAIDGSVLLFTLALALGAGVIFGALPVVHVLRSDLSGIFRSETRGGTASRRAVLMRSGLVTGQVALAFLLLSGAGLLFMSFRAAVAVDPGFEPEGVLTGGFSLPSARYPDGDSRVQLADRLLGQVRSLPGVEEAAVTTQLPFSGDNSSSVILPEGYTLEPGESLLSPFQTWVSPGYFEAMGIGLREGRLFDASDGPDATNALIIDEWLARRYWPDSSPLGKRMMWGTVPEPGQEVPPDRLFTIVGVVETVKQNDLTSSEHVGAYYMPYRQQPARSFLMLVVKGPSDPTGLTPALRSTLSRLDPELPFFGVETMESRIADSLTSRRAPMLLLAIFAGVALFLAVVGLYGVLAYSVAQRTREIGIRMAMGSAPGDVFRLVVSQGLRVTGLGLAAGLVASVGAVRVIRSLLFGVQPADPTVLAMVAALLGIVAVAACVLPAYRATRVDPTEALTEA